MNDIALAYGYTMMTLTTAGIAWFIAGWSIQAWRRRKGRSTPRASQRTPECGDNEQLLRQRRASVGRPEPVILTGLFATGVARPFDLAWRENWNSWDELAADLTDGGKSLLEIEREKI